MAGKTAPPISFEYTVGPQSITRWAIGSDMDRGDVHEGKGWGDWSQNLKDENDKDIGRKSYVNPRDHDAVAPVGHAQFNKIAANRNCLDCHKVKDVQRRGRGLAVEDFARLGPVEARLVAATKTASAGATRQPAKADHCATPYRKPPIASGGSGGGQGQGPVVVQGPPGPRGPAGPGATIRIGQVVSVPPGSQPRVTNSNTAQDAVLNFQIPEGEPGSDGQVDYQKIVKAVLAQLPDIEIPTAEMIAKIALSVFNSHKNELKVELTEADYIEIARRVKVPASAFDISLISEEDMVVIMSEIQKRLKPFYIGAKDGLTGRVTMQPTAVDLGDTVYVYVEPPSLDYGKIAAEVQKRLNQ